jgi:hypothetical protein
VDESVQSACGFVATAFVFGSGRFDQAVERVLRQAGLIAREEEFKSSARMDADPRMQAARGGLMAFADSKARVAVFFGHITGIRWARIASRPYSRRSSAMVFDRLA